MLLFQHRVGRHRSRIFFAPVVAWIGLSFLLVAPLFDPVRAGLSPDEGGSGPQKVPQFQPTKANPERAPRPSPAGMVWIPGGEFSMGMRDPGEGMPHVRQEVMHDALPVHRVYVAGFWMDETEVTNEQFAKFVRATGYVTIAERPPTAGELPGVPVEELVAGAPVFVPPADRIPLDDYRRWWSYEKGADWRHPTGPGSNLEGRGNFPVVQVAFADAAAYALRAGKRLPTEAEWEFAARGGRAEQFYPWGNDFRPGGRSQANTFQGQFPGGDTAEDGFAGIAPVKSFPPNDYGLYDVAGNVWEWCSDWYRADYYAKLAVTKKVARNPQGPPASLDPSAPAEKKRVQRGGSFLCSDQYCARYLVGARGKGEISTSGNHLGFRCVRDPNPGRKSPTRP